VALEPFGYEAWLPAANNRGELEFNFPAGVGSKFSKPRIRGIGRPTRTALSEIPSQAAHPRRPSLRPNGSRLVGSGEKPIHKVGD
jgi:hypothetical protein